MKEKPQVITTSGKGNKRQLVYIGDREREPYTLHTIIADYAELNRVSVRKLIDTHKAELETFGKVSFEMTKINDGRGRKTKIYHLNEQQATLLITWLDNTEKVREFKLSLVKAFYDLRGELNKFKLQRALEKPIRKSLTDAIKDWPYCNPHSYKHFTDLLLKKVTGQNAKQLKLARPGGATSLDLLTALELEQYIKLEQLAISLIGLSFSYDQIKRVIYNAP